MPIHESLPPGLAPGGLVMVTYDAANNEIVRSVLTADRLTDTDTLAIDAAEEHIRHGGGGCLVAYDGDTGEQSWSSGEMPLCDADGVYLTPQVHQFESLIGLTPQGKGLAYSWPWMAIGVFGTAETITEDDDGGEWWHQFVYTSGLGPLELWAPCASIEGRAAGHDLVSWILNVLAYTYKIGYLMPGQSVVVPLGVPGGEDVDTVWWIGQPTNDTARYQVFQSRAMGVIPIRWSSGLGWKEDDDG